MRKVFCLFIFIFLPFLAVSVYALTPEEILILKRSGVSDEKILEMQNKEGDASPQPIPSTEMQKKNAEDKPDEKVVEKAEKEAEKEAEKKAEKKDEEKPKDDSTKKASTEEEKEIALTVNIKAIYEKWSAAKKQFGRWILGPYEVTKIFGEAESEFGLSVGPEISFHYKYLFLRGSYLYGENDFLNIGKGRRQKMGFDIGIGKTGGVFVGYRDMSISFLNWNNVNMTGHSISDVVWGFFFRTNPYKSGFKANFEMALGLAVTTNALSDYLSNSYRYYKYMEHEVVGEAELDIGYRFKKIPFEFNIGYGGWIYDKAVQSNPLVRYENWGHGANLKLSYTF